jgi:undecaprenyl pyrophosphate phosphatase UppP
MAPRINGIGAVRLVEASVRRSESSIGQELMWLLVWAAIFIVITVLLLKFVVPHHFNDRVAVMISAIVSGIAMIALRAYVTRRA